MAGKNNVMQILDIFIVHQFWADDIGLLDLGGGLCSTECHISSGRSPRPQPFTVRVYFQIQVDVFMTNVTKLPEGVFSDIGSRRTCWTNRTDARHENKNATGQRMTLAPRQTG